MGEVVTALEAWVAVKPKLGGLFERLERTLCAALESDAGEDSPRIESERTLTMRWAGQEGTLTIALGDEDDERKAG